MTYNMIWGSGVIYALNLIINRPHYHFHLQPFKQDRTETILRLARHDEDSNPYMFCYAAGR